MKRMFLSGVLLVASLSTASAVSGGDELHAQGIEVKLSDSGEIITVRLGTGEKAIAARTRLGGCLPAAAKTIKPAAGGLAFTRTLRHAATGRTLTLTDCFRPAGDSLRWEIEICGDGPPWTTEIITELDYPATAATRFWTAWSDPAHRNDWARTKFSQRGDSWRDPLRLLPLAEQSWMFGGFYALGDYIAVPLATLAEPADDAGLSLVFSPEDTILAGSRLTTTPAGTLRFSRVNYRLGGGRPVRFALDLTAHEADWRGGLRWMVRRYPQYFDPPNPAADSMAGCAAYSGDENPIDVAKFKRMAFRVNWKLSDDFVYQGMFIPPVRDADEKWERSCGEPAPPNKPRWTSCRRLNDYARYMKENGFFVLNYFNCTDFGKNMQLPAKRKPDDPELWKDPQGFLAARLSGALLLAGSSTWYGASVLDAGEPCYQDFLLEQARRHNRLLPDAAGICVDQLDWLDKFNPRADDGVTWVGDKPVRSLCMSWKGLLARLGPEMHRAGKVIFASPGYSRLDTLREVDGIYSEWGHDGRSLNTTALMGLHKPAMAWTCKASLAEPDPDSFMQRYLYLGVYPTAPYPGNHHAMQPEPAAERLYLDYGPLLDAMRGKKWVLAAHCIRCGDGEAKVNLFAVPHGYALPVTFGRAPQVQMRLSGLALGGAGPARVEALQPGEAAAVPLDAQYRNGILQLTVPLKRGCAMVRISTDRRSN